MPETITEKQTHTISDLPVFSTGTWNGDKYTTADLDEMIRAFGEVGFKPPIKLGHGEDQKILKESGMPAAGWVNSIYRKGDTLYANIVDIPKKIFDLIRMKAYDRVSVEIYWNYDKAHSRVLRAIALLGAEIPEVTDIDSISSLFSDDKGHKYAVYAFVREDEKEDADKTEGGHKAMSKEEKTDNSKESLEMKKKTEELETTVAKFQEMLDEQTKKNKDLAAALEKEKSKRRWDQIHSKVTEYIRQKKITPAQGPILETMMNAIPETEELVVKYTKDNETVEEKMDALSLFSKFVEKQPQYIGEEKLNEGIKKSGDQEIDDQVRDYCKKNNLNYDDAKDYKTALLKVTGGKEV